MKLNMKFKINGREVPFSRAGAELEKVVKKQVSSNVAAVLLLKCVHRRYFAREPPSTREDESR